MAVAAALFAAATVVWEYWRGLRARIRATQEPPPLALARLVARARPRYGGYLVHLGMALIAVGVISSQFYQQSRESTLPVGASTTVGRYELTYRGLTEQQAGDARTVAAHLDLSEDGGPTHSVAPARVFYESFNDQPIARGMGDTATDAIKTMLPLQWSAPRSVRRLRIFGQRDKLKANRSKGA